MSKKSPDRHIDLLTSEAKKALLELRVERAREGFAELLDEARRDPISLYRKKRWYPRYVVWELTLACNMQCEHCGSAAGKKRDDELTLDEMYRVCDELADLGTERVTLLGGEPLVHPHWEAIGKRIKENGFGANVITNGWTLDREDVCDALVRAGLTIVGISLDGLEENHDKLRKRPGSFRRALRGMELLRQRSMPFAVSTVVTNDSINDLAGMHDLFEEEGVKVWQLQIGAPLGRLERDNPVVLDPRRLHELQAFIFAKQQSPDTDMRIDIADCVGYYGDYEDRGIRMKRNRRQSIYWTGCHAGIHGIGIDSNGGIKGCASLPSTPEFIEGNIRERSLADIWNDPNAFSYTRQFRVENLSGFCAKCEYGPLCKAGCTSAALGHSGSIGENPMCVQHPAAKV